MLGNNWAGFRIWHCCFSSNARYHFDVVCSEAEVIFMMWLERQYNLGEGGEGYDPWRDYTGPVQGWRQSSGSHQTRDVYVMLAQSWANVTNGWPTLYEHTADVSCSGVDDLAAQTTGDTPQQTRDVVPMLGQYRGSVSCLLGPTSVHCATPTKQERLAQCRINVGPGSKSLDQH